MTWRGGQLEWVAPPGAQLCCPHRLHPLQQRQCLQLGQSTLTALLRLCRPSQRRHQRQWPMPAQGTPTVAGRACPRQLLPPPRQQDAGRAPSSWRPPPPPSTRCWPAASWGPCQPHPPQQPHPTLGWPRPSSRSWLASFYRPPLHLPGHPPWHRPRPHQQNPPRPPAQQPNRPPPNTGPFPHPYCCPPTKPRCMQLYLQHGHPSVPSLLGRRRQ